MEKYYAKTGGVLYVLWGLLHINAAYGIYRLSQAVSLDDGLAKGRLSQAGWDLAIIAILTIVVGATLNWKNDKLGYWLNFCVVGLADIGYFLFIYNWAEPTISRALLGPALWVLAVLFSTLAIRQVR